MAAAYVPGLQGIVAARTRLSRVDGQRGELVIGGFPVEEIGGRATFEELVFLLWNDRLPNARELAALRDLLERVPREDEHAALPVHHREPGPRGDDALQARDVRARHA